MDLIIKSRMFSFITIGTEKSDDKISWKKFMWNNEAGIWMSEYFNLGMDEFTYDGVDTKQFSIGYLHFYKTN